MPRSFTNWFKVLMTVLILHLVGITYSYGQADSTFHIEHLNFFSPSPDFSPKRYYTLLGVGGVGYGVFSYGLYNSWYKDQSTGKFKLFNDSGEWLQMDKAGHVFSSYFQNAYIYQMSHWSGQSKNKSLLAAAISSTLFQTTLEVMDGFADKWGFSLSDIGANVVGLSVFQVQQMVFDKQIISLKESAYPVKYDDLILETRANELYGKSKLARMLKDYNTQTYWASVDLHAFVGDRWPKWLNLAFGYGADGMFGGYENKWSVDNKSYDYSTILRSRQYYLAPDINLKSFKPRNAFGKMLLNGLDIFKTPSPAISYSKAAGWQFHLLFW